MRTEMTTIIAWYVRRFRASWITWICVVVVVLGGMQGCDSNSAYSRGYAGGQLWGELDRNAGNRRDVETAKSSHLFDIQTTGGNTGDPAVASDPRYKKSVLLPEPGTREYGEYMRGFEQGYRNGYR